jgi:hypothetical protein
MGVRSGNISCMAEKRKAKAAAKRPTVRTASRGRTERSQVANPRVAPLSASDRLELVEDLAPPIWTIADADGAMTADTEWQSSVGAMGADLLEDTWDYLRIPSSFEWLLLSFTYGRAAIPRSLQLRGWDAPGAAVPTRNGVSLVPKTVLDVTLTEGGLFWSPERAVPFTMDLDCRISLSRSTMAHLGAGKKRSILAAVDNRRAVTAMHLIAPSSMDSMVPSLEEW